MAPLRAPNTPLVVGMAMIPYAWRCCGMAMIPYAWPLLRDGDDPIRVALLVGRGAIHRAQIHGAPTRPCRRHPKFCPRHMDAHAFAQFSRQITACGNWRVMCSWSGKHPCYASQSCIMARANGIIVVYTIVLIGCRGIGVSGSCPRRPCLSPVITPKPST